MKPSRCVRIPNLLGCAVLTQHIKTVLILQLVKLGYMFRPLPSYHQANKEIVLIKVMNVVFCIYYFGYFPGV